MYVNVYVVVTYVTFAVPIATHNLEQNVLSPLSGEFTIFTKHALHVQMYAMGSLPIVYEEQF